MKSAAGKRPPDEENGPGKEAELGTTHSTIRLNFVKHFHIFAVLVSDSNLFIFCNSDPKFTFFDDFSEFKQQACTTAVSRGGASLW